MNAHDERARWAGGWHAAALAISAATRREIAIAREDERIAEEAAARTAEIAALCAETRALSPGLPLVEVERGLRVAAEQASRAHLAARALREALQARLAREEGAVEAAARAIELARGDAPPVETASKGDTAQACGTTAPTSGPLGSADTLWLLRITAEGVSRRGSGYTCEEVCELLGVLARQIETGEPIARPPASRAA